MKSEPVIEYPLKAGIFKMKEQGERIHLDRTSGILIISFISLLVFPLLYILRFLDDNTLTSWQWVFHNARLGQIYGLMFFGLALAYLVSRISVPIQLALM